MKYTLIPVAACLVLFLVISVLADNAGDEPTPPQAEPIELSGTLHRPAKWTPQLEVWPAGQLQKIDLQGKLLDGVAQGAPIWVKGVVRSRLHTGGTDSPFPAQWMVWIEVTELKVLDDKQDILKNDRR